MLLSRLGVVSSHDWPPVCPLSPGGQSIFYRIATIPNVPRYFIKYAKIATWDFGILSMPPV